MLLREPLRGPATKHFSAYFGERGSLSQHTIMRRSTRIRWQIPIRITSVDPRVPFDETSETVAVNAHGCGVICRVPLEKGTAVKLGLLPDNQEVMAHIADVVKLGDDGRAWLLGLQLDVPANVWGVRNPPHDWDKSMAGQAAEAKGAPLAASAAAGAGMAGAAVSTATLAAPEFSVVSPAPPSAAPVAVQSAAVAVPLKTDAARSAVAGNNGGLNRRASDAGRGNESQPASAPAYHVRDRDWAELRRQMEEHLQDLMWQVDDQVETKLEQWKEHMVDAEARLDSLCQLQDRLQAHLTVLSEIVKEKVKPEAEGGAAAEAPASSAQIRQDAAASAESAVATTASQVEEIRQLQQWMQSLIHLVPQAVEQHANEAVGAVEERLRAQAEEQAEGLRKQVSELQEKLAQAIAAQPPAVDAAAEEEKRRASEAALRAIEEEIRESLQKALREESEKLQQQLRVGQQAAQEEAERLRQLQEEATVQAAQRSAEAGQQNEQLKAAESTVREIGDRLHATLQAELETEKQRIQQAAAAVEEKASRLQAQISELTAGTEEARRARESLESVVASLTQAASQQVKEDVAAGLQRMANEAQQQAERRGQELAAQLAESQRLQSAAQEQLQQLARQAGELAARLEEGERGRELLQSRLDSAVAAAEQKLECGAAEVLQRVSSQSEDQIKHIEERVSAQQKKLEELGGQRQQELQSALEAHMKELRNSSESMLRQVSEELRGSLNTHLKEEFASQRHIWEKQRESSQAEKAWVETRANELAGRWEARLQGYIERATGEAVNRLRTDVEKAASDIIREQMEAVEKRLSGSLEPLLTRAEGSGSALEKLLTSVREETRRAEAENAAFQKQRDGAQDWMEKQMERLRQAVHDAVVETSGEIKGRIHMAVEMAREPIEQRSREAQRQVEELAERKSREMTDRLAEFEKAMSPRLQAHLGEAMEKFEKDTDELARKSVHRCQDDLAETLDSMLHLVRGKREGKSK